MTRSFSSVAKWVLCIVLIALLIATFACCLLFSPGASVASAYNATLPDDGIVGENLLSSSYFTNYKNSASWKFVAPFTSSDVVQSSEYCTFTSSATVSGTKLFYQDVYHDVHLPITISFYGRVTSGSISMGLFYGADFNNALLAIDIDGANSGEFAVHSFTVRASDYPEPPVIDTSNFQFTICTYGQRGATFDIQWLKVESGSEFTGYIPQSTTSDDYEQGYDDGYKQGTADGVISANDIFLCTAFAIQYDSTKKNIYISKEDAHSSYTNFVVNTIAMVFVPLSCLYYDGEDGGFYPKDIVRNSAGELPDINDSSYWITFDTLIECGQWLLDNPNDFLCSYYITGEAQPAALVFSDLTKLPNFMSGAGESYEVGYNDGYNTGQYDGNKTGYNQGYNAGYNEGVVSGADYSFLGLIGAVVDAPINAFQGLLDFDILGVNMSSFVMAMFSLCFIFLLLKLVLR